MAIRMMFVAALAALGLSANACGGKSGGPKPPAAASSLYDRLGGKPAITAVVDDFVGFVVADDRINAFFKNADAANLKSKLVDQICDATSGGKVCKYAGKDMKTAHTGMGIKDEHFNALVEDLVKALDKNKVGEKDKADLLGALAAMKGDIVSK